MAEDFNSVDALDFPLVVEPFAFALDGKEIVAELQRFDRIKADEEFIVKRTANPSENMRAASERQVSGGLAKSLDHAVYVVENASGTAAKVGVSSNPVKRMEQLQCGSPEMLRYTHLFWLPQKAAFGLEMFTLRMIGKLGKRLMGEWCAMSPPEAAYVIATLAKASNVPFSDSQMFRFNLRAMRRAGGIEEDADSSGYRRDPLSILTSKSGA